jgi:hypothetical protein
MLCLRFSARSYLYRIYASSLFGDSFLAKFLRARDKIIIMFAYSRLASDFARFGVASNDVDDDVFVFPRLDSCA